MAEINLGVHFLIGYQASQGYFCRQVVSIDGSNTVCLEIAKMFLAWFLTAIYVLIASFSAMMTYGEQRQTGGRSAIYTSLGFLACALWPITFLVVAVAAYRQTR